MWVPAWSSAARCSTATSERPARSATSSSTRTASAAPARAPGCLETILAVPHLRRRLDEAAAAGTDPTEVLTRVGEQLGAALAPVVGTLNLHELVLSGPPELLDGPLREATDRSIRERTMPVSSAGLVVRTSTLGEDVVLVGAAVLVLSGQLGVS